MSTFLSALGFLTAIPAPARALTPVSLTAFPLIGGIVGLILAAVLAACTFVSEPASSIVVVLAWALITRGLHLDGLSDTADALGSAHPRERRLEILKDPHPGVFGVTAIVLALLTKWSALSMMPALRIEALIAACVFARWQTSLVALWFKPIPVSGQPGLGSSIVGQTARFHVFAATAYAALIACVIEPRVAVAAALAAALTGLLTAFAASRSLGGVNGDVLGAGIELSEAMILLVILCLLT